MDKRLTKIANNKITLTNIFERFHQCEMEEFLDYYLELPPQVKRWLLPIEEVTRHFCIHYDVSEVELMRARGEERMRIIPSTADSISPKYKKKYGNSYKESEVRALIFVFLNLYGNVFLAKVAQYFKIETPHYSIEKVMLKLHTDREATKKYDEIAYLLIQKNMLLMQETPEQIPSRKLNRKSQKLDISFPTGFSGEWVLPIDDVLNEFTKEFEYEFGAPKLLHEIVPSKDKIRYSLPTVGGAVCFFLQNCYNLPYMEIQALYLPHINLAKTKEELTKEGDFNDRFLKVLSRLKYLNSVYKNVPKKRKKFVL